MAWLSLWTQAGLKDEEEKNSTGIPDLKNGSNLDFGNSVAYMEENRCTDLT